MEAIGAIIGSIFADAASVEESTLYVIIRGAAFLGVRPRHPAYTRLARTSASSSSNPSASGCCLPNGQRK